MELIDLSMEIYRDMPIYPDLPGPSLTVDEDWGHRGPGGPGPSTTAPTS